MKEIWKDIKGYEFRYQISNVGRIKSLRRYVYNHFSKEKILTPVLTKKGYLQIRLSDGKRFKGYKIHRLVAQAFIPNPDNKPQVNHIDGNKLNNKVDNLEWCTGKENMIHAAKNKLLKDVSGNKNPNCKKINQFDLDGNFIKEWDSIYDITNAFKIDRHIITKCCTFKCKSACGYIWRYTN